MDKSWRKKSKPPETENESQCVSKNNSDGIIDGKRLTGDYLPVVSKNLSFSQTLLCTSVTSCMGIHTRKWTSTHITFGKLFKIV